MSPLKRRAFSSLMGLALLSVCLWAGYEFLQVARMKQSRLAADRLCKAVGIGMTVEQAAATAKASKHSHRIAISSKALEVDFGHGCHCRLQIDQQNDQQKIVDKNASCMR